MTLADYIEKNGVRKDVFASVIGVSVTSLNRYLTGVRRPEWCVLMEIKSATGGAVMPNDFLIVDDDSDENQPPCEAAE